jgi:hypothetical protein
LIPGRPGRDQRLLGPVAVTPVAPLNLLWRGLRLRQQHSITKYVPLTSAAVRPPKVPATPIDAMKRSRKKRMQVTTKK